MKDEILEKNRERGRKRKIQRERETSRKYRDGDGETRRRTRRSEREQDEEEATWMRIEGEDRQCVMRRGRTARKLSEVEMCAKGFVRWRARERFLQG